MPAPPIRYADDDGVAIAYQVVGDGARDLVFVPGFVWHLEVIWEDPDVARFLRRMAGFGRLILYDKREQGLSDRTGQPPTLEQGMDDLLAVLNAVGAQRPVVFGISEGAPMCALFAATHPERCERLVLFGAYSRLVGSADHPAGVSEEDMEGFFAMVREGWGGPVALDLFAPSVAADETKRDWWARLLRQGTSPSGARNLLRMYYHLDVRGVLPAIGAPTLLVTRTGDRIAPPEQALLMAGGISGARFVELPGEDHLAFFEHPEAVLGEVEEFFTGRRSAPPGERVLATVLFTDIAGSTEHATALGDRRWRDRLEAHDRAVRREVAARRGRVVKTMGDGALAVFDGPARAIEAAAAIRDAVAPLDLHVRAGLHTGECELIGQDVGGIAVHIGARVAARAQAGEVLVSRTVTDLVAGSGLTFADRGEHELKGVPGRWRLFAAQG